MSLGFHPQIDSFSYELFDVDKFRLNVMDCVGALICFQKKFKILHAPDEAKWRVFWHSVTQVSSFAENVLKQTNDALSIVLESFPDEQKSVDGRSWLPLHFAVSLEKPNPADISAIILSRPESIKAGSDSRRINPCHLFSMSSSANPDLMILQHLRTYNSHMGQSMTLYGSTPLHLINDIIWKYFIPTALHLSRNFFKSILLLFVCVIMTKKLPFA